MLSDRILALSIEGRVRYQRSSVFEASLRRMMMSWYWKFASLGGRVERGAGGQRLPAPGLELCDECGG